MRRITLNPSCTEMLTLGKIGENEATELTVDVPKQYRDGNIYLDFGLPNGEKTRTPALGEGFSFVVPHELLRAEGWAALDIVYKKDNTTKVLGSFRAKISGAVDAEQTLVLEYKDVIEDLAIRVEALEDSASVADAALNKLVNLNVSTETLAPGSNATVSKTETETGYTLAFGVPRGDKGEQGERGETGATGERGLKGDTGAQGPIGNVMYATFDIDFDAGELVMTTPDGYTGPTFSINDETGELEVSI